MALPRVFNHLEQGSERLLWQWRNSPNLKGLLQSYMESVQEVETTLFQMLNARGLDTATGEQLDILGKIIGEPRTGRSDEVYREALKQRVVVNNADGSTEVVLELIQLVTGASRVTFFEHYPASLIPFATSEPSLETLLLMVKAKSAGVRLTQMLFDPTDATVIPQEVGDVSGGNLVTDVGDLIVDDNGNNISVTVYGTVSPGLSPLASTNDPPGTSALASVVSFEIPISEATILVDNNGNEIVDDNSNQIQIVIPD